MNSPGRRAFLLAGAALALTGCSPSNNGAGLVSLAPTGRAAAGIGERTPTPSASASAPHAAQPAPTKAPGGTSPTREEIITRFAGRTPSYWGLEAPRVLTHLPHGSAGIALTLDFCGGTGGAGADLTIIDLLRRLQVPATLFLNGRWMTANRALAQDLAADALFEIANHGTNHYPLSVNGAAAYGISGTEGAGSVYDEIMINDARLADLTGARPRFFRAGTAYLDDVAAAICLALDLIPTGFSVNADAGATYPAGTVATETAVAVPGNIIIAHGNHSASGTGPGLTQALPYLLAQGRTFTTLSAAITP